MSDTPPPTTTNASPPAGIAGQARALWAKLPGRARIAAIASTVAIVGLIAYVMTSGGSAGWVSVTSGLTSEDVSTLETALNEAGIPNRTVAGNVSKVPSKHLYQAKAVAVVAQVPSTGDGWKVTEGGGLGITSHQEKIRLQRALQGELVRTIRGLGPVERARVQIAFGLPSVFSGQAKPPTASVQVHLRAGAKLAPAQVLGIKQLVARAISGLEPEHVVVIDQDATLLSGDERTSEDEQSSIETQIATQVRAMLETVTGVGKVKVVARVELDRRAINKTEEHFDDPKILSRQETTTPAPAPAAAASGISGTQGNLPGTPAATMGTVATGTAVIQSTTNHQLGRTMIQTTEPEVRIAKIDLAVLVDENLDEDGEPVPRTDDEKAQYKELAHTAAGLSDPRGDELTIHFMPFAAPPEMVALAPLPTSKLPVPLPVAAGAGAVLLLAVIVLLVRRRRHPAEVLSARIALPAPVAELERAMNATPGLSAGEASAVPALPSGRTLEERVVGAVRSDVQRASRVLASWLAEPDPVAANNQGKAARA